MEQREAPIDEQVDVDPEIIVNVNTLLAAAADPVAPEPINLLAAAAAYLDPEVFQRAREGTRPGDLISDSEDEEEEMEVDTPKGRVEGSTCIQNDSSEDTSEDSSDDSTSDSNDGDVSSDEKPPEVEGGDHKNIYESAYRKARLLPANYAAFQNNSGPSTSSSVEESHKDRVPGPSRVMQAIKAKERYRHPIYYRGNETTANETTNEVPQLSFQAILLPQEVPQPSTSRSALAQEQSEIACSSGSSKLAKKQPAAASRTSQCTRNPVSSILTPKTPRKKKELTADDISKVKKLHDDTVQSLSNHSTTPASGTVFIDIGDMVADLNTGPLEPPHNLDQNVESTEALHSVCPSLTVDKEDKNDHVDEDMK